MLRNYLMSASISLRPQISRKFPSRTRVKLPIHPSSFGFHPSSAPLSPQTPSLPGADPRSGRPRCAGRKSKFLAVIPLATVFAFLALMMPQTAQSQSVPAVPPATQPANMPIAARTLELWQRWEAAFRAGRSTSESAHGPLLDQLAAAPDADLCFLKTVTGDAPRGDWHYCAALEQLGKLNSQRTFETATAGLKSASRWKREDAIAVIKAFQRPECVPLLAKIVDGEPERQVRTRAMEALTRYADPLVEATLLKAAKDQDMDVAIAAARALAFANSEEGLEAARHLLSKADGDNLRRAAVLAVAAFRRKAAVAVLLDEYALMLPRKDDSARSWKNDAELILRARAAITAGVLGPKPDTLEQWRDWWAHAEPLLTDDLKLKASPAKIPRNFVEADFSKEPDAIELRAKVDSKEYRVGDPIRLELEMENHSKSPCSLVLPNLPSGWRPTMGYGIRLKRGEVALIDLKPSGDYRGSYSGPPSFRTLAPGEVFRSAICLQHFLYQVDRPLPEGEYELTVAFDSSQFPGIRPQGVQWVHRWDASPLHFSIKGEALQDPAALLNLIGKMAGLRWIEQDLTSPQPERREPAWRAVFNYGDSRLSPLVEKIKTEHPEAAYHWLNAKNLQPFERRLQRPGD